MFLNPVYQILAFIIDVVLIMAIRYQLNFLRKLEQVADEWVELEKSQMAKKNYNGRR